MEDLQITEIFVLPGKMAYMKLPSEKITKFLNDTFSSCRVDKVADCITGSGHRWKSGHDLLIDVPKRFINNGIKDGFKSIGHILTDISTPDGIPIPLLSKNGLGEFLHNVCGFKIKELCFTLNDTVNFIEKGISILCVGEGGMDILDAFSGKLKMNFTTFCDTIGEGAFQIAFGIPTGNGLAITTGIENIIAGIVSAWKTYTIQIDIVPFFGSTLASALLGFCVAKYLSKNDNYAAIVKATKSGLITGLFQLSSSFAYGTAIYFAYLEGIKYIANRDSKEIDKIMKVDKNYYQKFIDILNSFDDKEAIVAYSEYDKEISDEIISSGGMDTLIGEDALSTIEELPNSEIMKLMKGDFLVNYLERKIIKE